MSEENATTQELNQLFARYISYMRNTSNLLLLYIKSLGTQIFESDSQDMFFDLARKLTNQRAATSKQEMNQAGIDVMEKLASVAQEEATKGFPTLHAQTIVAVWAALETLIEDLSVALALKFSCHLGKRGV